VTNCFVDKLPQSITQEQFDLFDDLTRYYFNDRYPDYAEDAFEDMQEGDVQINVRQNKGGVFMVANVEAVMKEARRYADEVRRHLPVEKAYLFGSYAKGTADEFSDVDVVFFLRDYGGKRRFDVGVQLLRLCRNYKVCFEPLVFKTTEIERDNPFVNEVLRTGIEI